MKKIFISILNFNGKKNTIECLKSISNVKKTNFELRIIVVDNASSEDFFLDKDFKTDMSIKLIKNDVNLGFSGGHNVGIQHALENGADYIMILNNDTYVDCNFLTELLKIAEKDTDIGILVPKIYFAPGFEFHKDRYKKEELGRIIWYAGGAMDWKNVIGHHRGVDEVDRGQFDRVEETELATGCCMMVKKEVFEKIGLLDDKYFLYYEDSDLNMRAKKAGFEIVYVPNAIIWHKNAGSAGGSGSTLQDYYITRNRLIFGMKYAPLRAKIALLRESLRVLLTGRHWQKRGALDFYMRKFDRGSYNDF